MWSGRVRRERALARGMVDFARNGGAGRGSRIVRWRASCKDELVDL